MPSPCSYKVGEAKEFASGEKYQDKSGRYYKIGKCKKTLFTDAVITKAKKSPGVGHYKYEEIIDKKISKPMRASRAY